MEMKEARRFPALTQIFRAFGDLAKLLVSQGF